jgi:hypothetical protein
MHPLIRAAVTALALLAAAPAGAVAAAPEPSVAALRAAAYRSLAGTPATCDTYALALYDRLHKAGVEARIVRVFASTRNTYDAHTFVEVRTATGWQIQDPTFDGFWTIGSRRASAVDIQEALEAGREQTVLWHGRRRPMLDYYVSPLLLFRIVEYVEQDAAGAWSNRRRVAALDELYFARRPVARSKAQVVVVRGGAQWMLGSYPLVQAPDGRWVSPILQTQGLPLTGLGPGQVTVLPVSQLPARQLAPRLAS